MLFMISSPAFDITTVTFISALIVLSVLSICFIFHFHLKSKSLPYLQGFNSLWTVRFLLVFLIFCWSITELLRSPFFRRKYIFTFLPSLAVSHQADICKIHLLLSLGFFEPAFLVTLLFLLNASIKKKTPNDGWAITFVFLTCIPLLIVHGFLIFFNPLEDRVPGLLRQTSVVLEDETVLCAYPFLNSVVFAGFGAAYCTWFLYSCWRVLSLVINKGLRIRIYGLVTVVLVALPVQILGLAFTVLWNPDDEMYGVVSLVVFMGAFCCAVAGEGILVIKPISDALDAGISCGRWAPRPVELREFTTTPTKEEKMAEEEEEEEREETVVGERCV